MTAFHYRLLADLVLTLHAALVLFVVGGLVAILAGNRWRWRWVNHLWFRLLHLATILAVVAESWLGITCPLTTWESWLRARGGSQGYDESFIEYWLQHLLFYDAPPWLFVIVYTLFAVAVAAAWWRFPPRR